MDVEWTGEEYVLVPREEENRSHDRSSAV
jgi:hypothetical protein